MNAPIQLIGISVIFVGLLLVNDGVLASGTKHDSDWPKTCDEAVAEVSINLSDKGKKQIRDTPFNELVLLNDGLGAQIQTAFGMWRGNNQLVKSCTSQRRDATFHPNDASVVIIESVWTTLSQN